jgi:hypothetical protein
MGRELWSIAGLPKVWFGAMLISDRNCVRLGPVDGKGAGSRGARIGRQDTIQSCWSDARLVSDRNWYTAITINNDAIFD